MTKIYELTVLNHDGAVLDTATFRTRVELDRAMAIRKSQGCRVAFKLVPGCPDCGVRNVTRGHPGCQRSTGQ